MQITYRYNIKEGRAGEYAKLVIDSEQVLREKSADGWTYVGTFFTVQGLGEFDCEQRWEMAEYANLGNAWGHDAEFDSLISKAQEFIDGRITSTVAKTAGEVVILE